MFDDDRRYAEAYSRGGWDEEKKERKIIKEEKEKVHWENHQMFRDMIEKARSDKKIAEEAKKAAEKLV